MMIHVMPRNFESMLAASFRLDDATWERHANPWSVWTRFTILPLLTVAIYSRIWIGPWAWAAVVVVVAWTWINPRVFPKPRFTDSWASRGVMGERVWIRRNEIPVPAHHRILPHFLNLIAMFGMGFWIWGLVKLSWWPLLLGLVLIYLGKLWFIDRMAWLYDDMRRTHPEYAAWYRPPEDPDTTNSEASQP